MAIFTTGPLIGAISGSIGGVQFSNRRSGGVLSSAQIRTKPLGKNITAVRRAMARAQTDWQRIDASTRTSWDTAAQTWPHKNRFGIRRRLSGHQLFLLLTVRYWPFPVVDSTQEFPLPPVLVLPQLADPIRLEFTAGGPYLLVTSGPFSPSLPQFLVEIGRPVSTNQYRTWNSWRTLSRFQALPSTILMTAEVQDQYGDFIAGETVFARVTLTTGANGTLNRWIFSTTVEAP